MGVGAGRDPAGAGDEQAPGSNRRPGRWSDENRTGRDHRRLTRRRRVRLLYSTAGRDGVGHIGIYREHDTLKPVEYYFKIPRDGTARDFFILDPMLADRKSVV